MFAGQQNHVVREVELDFGQRKVREWNRLCVHGVSVPIVASQHACVVLDGQLPNPESLRLDRGNKLLRQRDLVKRPVRASLIRYVLPFADRKTDSESVGFSPNGTYSGRAKLHVTHSKDKTTLSQLIENK